MRSALLRLAALAALVGAAAPARAQSAGASIDFVPPGGVNEGTSVSLRAAFNSGVPPSYAYVFVRPLGQSAYLPVVLRVNGSALSGELPAAMLRQPGIEYYFSVTDIDNNVVTLPAVSPAASPFRLTVSPGPNAFRLTPVFPDEGLTATDVRPWFHFQYSNAAGGLDIASFQLAVDGRRVALPCQFEVGELFCSVDWDLAVGDHAVVASVKRLSDGQTAAASYTFSRGLVAVRPTGGRRALPHGKAVTRLAYLSVPNAPQYPSQMLIPAGNDRLYPELDLDSAVQVGSASVSLLVRHAGVDRQEQPSPSRYTLRVERGAASLDLGDFVAVWSDLGLSQMRVRGAQAGVSTEGGGLRLDAVGGQTRRAIYQPELGTAVLARYLYGVSLSAKLRALALRWYALDARDDAASVPQRGSLDPVGARQVGAAASVALPAGWKTAAELSFDAYQPRLGASAAMRGRGAQASVGRDGAVVSWSVLGRETRPGFVPLGDDAIQADYRGVEAQGSARLLGGRAVLSTSGQDYRDNTEDQKPVTFHALFHQSNLMLQTWQGGPSLLFGFGEQRQRTVSDLVPLLRSANRNWTGGLTQNLGGFSLGASYGLSSYRDGSPTAFSDGFDLRTVSLNAGWTGAGAGLTLSGQRAVNADLTNGNVSRALGFTAQGNLTRGPLRLDGSYTHNVGRDQRRSIDNRQSDASAQAEWRIRKDRFLRLAYDLISYSNRIVASQSYKEARSTLSYGFSF